MLLPAPHMKENQQAVNALERVEAMAFYTFYKHNMQATDHIRFSILCYACLGNKEHREGKTEWTQLTVN